MSKDITEVLSVERVRAAYEATKLRPRRRSWTLCPLDGPPYACAVGAVLLARQYQGHFTQSDVAYELDLAHTDVAAFLLGFDGHDLSGEETGWPGAIAAWKHGRAVARAVFSESGGAA